MKDFKKMPKMADGGQVLTEAFTESLKNRLKERFPDPEPKKMDKRPFENSAERNLRGLRTGTSGGGMASGSTRNLIDPDSPLNRKKGGRIKK